MNLLLILVLAFQTLLPRTVSPVASPAQAILYAQEAQRDPLTPRAIELREQALEFAMAKPKGIDVCTVVLKEMDKSGSTHVKEIGTQMIISAAAYFYEHSPSHPICVLKSCSASKPRLVSTRSSSLRIRRRDRPSWTHCCS